MVGVESSKDCDADEPSLLQSLRGETGSPFSACKIVPGYNPGCHSQILTGSSSGAVFLWPLAPGRPPRPLRLGGHREVVTCVTCSRGGGLLASASADASIMLWKNQAMRQSPAVLRLHFSPVRSVDISNDEQLLLTASDDKLLKLASIASRRFVASFVGHSNWVRCAKFSPDAKLAVSGSDDKTVRLWDTERHSLVRSWHDQSDAVCHVDFEPNGGAIVACSKDSVINVFDVRSKELRQHYNRAHGSSAITQVAFHPAQDLLLSSSIDQTLRVWDLRAGRLHFTISGHRKAVHACSWEHTGGRFISCDDDLVHIWTLPKVTLGDRVPDRPEATSCEILKESTSEANANSSTVVAPPSISATHQTHQVRPHPHELPPAGKPAFEPEFVPVRPEPPVVSEETHQTLAIFKEKPDVAEVVANAVEKMVTQMDVLTRSLQSLESRLVYTENAVSDLSKLMATRRPGSS